MTTDIQDVWLGIATLGHLLTAVGLAIVVVGSTRLRHARAGEADSGIPFAAAVIAFAAVGREVAYDDSDSSISMAMDAAMIGMIALGVLGGVAERGTRIAHTLIGVVVGAVAAPLVVRAVDIGLVADVVVNGRQFVDPEAMASQYLLLGVMALVGSLVVGPRLGKLGPGGAARFVPGRSEATASVGGLLVATCMTLAIAGRLAPVRAPSTTAFVSLVGASAGLLAAVFVGYLYSGRAEALTLARAAVAGTVASVAGATSMSPMWAVLVGGVGGGLAFAADRILDSARIDDPVGVFAMFGLPSAWALLAVGVASPGRGLDQFGAQLSGLLIVAAWAVVVGFLSFGFIRLFGLLRVRADDEVEGLSSSG
jgi:Amt family ammonium transporter